MVQHRLKTWPEAFHAMWEGDKTFELRRDDRGFELGDHLLLHEWDPRRRSGYTGAWIKAEITFILQAGIFPGLEDGHVIMALRFIAKGRAMCCP